MKCSFDQTNRTVKLSTNQYAKIKMYARPSSLINTEDHSLTITWKMEEVGIEECSRDIFITVVLLEAQSIVLQQPDPTTYDIQIKYPGLNASQDRPVIQIIHLDDSEEEGNPSNDLCEEKEQHHDDDLETIRKISVTATCSNPFSVEYILNGCYSYNSMHNNAVLRLHKMTSDSTWNDTLNILDTAFLQFKLLEPRKTIRERTFY